MGSSNERIITTASTAMMNRCLFSRFMLRFPFFPSDLKELADGQQRSAHADKGAGAAEHPQDVLGHGAIAEHGEQGQTVAASFETPTLFEVAEDLSKMQIEASVSEADIGYIKPDMPVLFTVDAYPNDTFAGTIRQVRLSPTEDENVVMYTVIIEIDNSSRKLLPGMTASVTVKADEAKDVLMISAMALQYKPSAAVKAAMDVKKIDDIAENQDIVYLFENGKIVPRIVTKGLSDMTNIEIKEGLKQGEKVIVEALFQPGRR